MRGRAVRFMRHQWSFRVWAHKSGEIRCPVQHRNIPLGRPCPECKAVV